MGAGPGCDMRFVSAEGWGIRPDHFHWLWLDLLSFISRFCTVSGIDRPPGTRCIRRRIIAEFSNNSHESENFAGRDKPLWHNNRDGQGSREIQKRKAWKYGCDQQL